MEIKNLKKKWTMGKKINSVLISVFDKSGLNDLIQLFKLENTIIYSTGGTWSFLVEQGLKPIKVEDLTGYPSILDGRVKTLHPGVFAGILAKREDDHINQMNNLNLPLIDMVIVDLYPFEETVKNTIDHNQIIEKIDIGGISLIRAAAKNYKDVLVVPSKEYYQDAFDILSKNNMVTSVEERKSFAKRSFATSMHYDTAIYKYFAEEEFPILTKNIQNSNHLRYGENPHQNGTFYGNLNDSFEILNGKPLSYNNLVDVDAAINIISEFKDENPTFAILKHTNACGLSTRDTISEAWNKALEGDPLSAFGGVLISNSKIDIETAQNIDKIFYEVLLAPEFEDDAIAFLSKKKKRTILKISNYNKQEKVFKNVLTGFVAQDADNKSEVTSDFKVATDVAPKNDSLNDLVFANKVVKHLKSNAIAFVKDQQLLGMGCGQTSRVDACRQGVEKALRLGLDLKGAVMSSDAFFPFPDSIEIAHKAGIISIIQPGGSIKDNLSIDYCNENKISMVFTGTRHFKH